MRQSAALGWLLLLTLGTMSHAAAAGFPYATFGVGNSSSQLTLAGLTDPIELNGFGVSVGFDLTEALLLELHYNRRSGERSSRMGGNPVTTSADAYEQELGLTFHRPAGIQTDIYLLARLHRVGVEASINGQRVAEQSDNGHTGGIGLRTRLLPPIEFYTEYRHTELGAARSDHQDLGLRLYLSSHTAISFNYALREDPPQTTTGIAFYY